MNKIIVSRTDSIGDVALTLPMCAWLKKRFPTAVLIFLGKEYTRQIIASFPLIDEFISEEQLLKMTPTERLEAIQSDAIIHVFPNKLLALLAKKAKIPIRVGTSHRAFHLFTCNKRVSFTRKKSALHESQLNFNLLRPFGLERIPDICDIQKLVDYFRPIPAELPQFMEGVNLLNAVILHPKSKGSAQEWPIQSYVALCNVLIEKNIPVLFTGTQEEGDQFRHELPKNPLVIDTTGKLSLIQLIQLISKVNALIASSTGPYHIAGLCNIKAIGLFSSRKPIHPGRWHALGKNSHWITFDDNCVSCKKGNKCSCIELIPVSQVERLLCNE